MCLPSGKRKIPEVKSRSVKEVEAADFLQKPLYCPTEWTGTDSVTHFRVAPFHLTLNRAFYPFLFFKLRHLISRRFIITIRSVIIVYCVPWQLYLLINAFFIQFFFSDAFDMHGSTLHWFGHHWTGARSIVHYIEQQVQWIAQFHLYTEK